MQNQIFVAIKRVSVVFMQLDLFGALDTVDHDILISHLEWWVEVKRPALEWFKSYLCN